MTVLTLDLMDLADVGAQPRKLAVEIHRQLRAQLGEVPLPVPLREVAMAAGIQEIIERQTDEYEGMLVAKADRSSGIIVLRAGMSPGRRNFTLGHEIGHFVNTYHKQPPEGFVCTTGGMAARRSGNIVWDKRPLQNRMEIEANEFSIALSVPIQEYRRERNALTGCDIGHVATLAPKFGLSKEAFAQVYVDTAPDRIGILLSKDGKLGRFILPKTFPYLGLAKGHPLPAASLSEKFRSSLSPGQTSLLIETRPDAWLDQFTSGITIYEQMLALSGGWAMTMLMVEEANEEERQEEAAIERSWSAPQFS